MSNEVSTSSIGHRWSHEEEESLVKSLQDGKSVDVIADLHKRTYRGIKCRMADLALRMIDTEGKSVQDAADLLHMTHFEIEDAQKSRESVRKNRALRTKNACKETKSGTVFDLLKDMINRLDSIEEKINTLCMNG